MTVNKTVRNSEKSHRLFSTLYMSSFCTECVISLRDAEILQEDGVCFRATLFSSNFICVLEVNNTVVTNSPIIAHCGISMSRLLTGFKIRKKIFTRYFI